MSTRKKIWLLYIDDDFAGATTCSRTMREIVRRGGTARQVPTLKTCAPAPCAACPFRSTSVPGYLGPWSAETLYRYVAGDGLFPCHKTVRYDNAPLHTTRACTGALLFLHRVAHVPRDPNYAAEVRDAVAAAESVGFEMSEILSLVEWFTHHSSPTAANSRTEDNI